MFEPTNQSHEVISATEAKKRATLNASALFHCGAKPVTRAELQRYTPPTGIFMERYQPYDHSELIDDIFYNIQKVFGTTDVVFSQEYGIKDTRRRASMRNSDGEVVQAGDLIPIPAGQMFGLLRLSLDDSTWDGDQLVTAIGIRSCWDGSFRPGCSVGTNVWICDNLCFSGDNVVFHRSTRNAPQRITAAIKDMLHNLPLRYKIDQEFRQQAKKFKLTNDQAYAILGRMFGRRVIGLHQLQQATSEWQEPSFEPFKERNAWSLVNGITHSMKKLPMNRLVDTTARISRFFEYHVLEDWKTTESRVVNGHDDEASRYSRSTYMGPMVHRS